MNLKRLSTKLATYAAVAHIQKPGDGDRHARVWENAILKDSNK